MIEQFIENFNTTEINTYSSIIRLGIGLILSIIIGMERQRRRQSAGARTFALIGLASTGAVLISIWIPQSYPHFLNGDPGRIAAQLVTGVGFLGAGTIIQSKGNVHGLTTAASILLVAIVGMCAGAGMFLPAIILTITAVLILIILERSDRYRAMSGDAKQLIIKFRRYNPDIDQITSIIRNHKIYIYGVTFSKNLEDNQSEYRIKIQDSAIQPLEPMIEAIKEISDIETITLTDM